MTKCVEFNGNLDMLGPETYLENRKTCGFAHLGNGGLAAIYANPETISLLIKRETWQLLDPDIYVDYFHIYKFKTTLFGISNGERVLELKYPSWWADRTDFKPSEHELITEEDTNEDFFGYVALIKDNAKMAKNLYELWRKNITD